MHYSIFTLSYGLALQRNTKTSVSEEPKSPIGATSPEIGAESAWHKLTPPIASPTDQQSVKFCDILRDETQQRQNLQKSVNKPLHLIQVS